MMMSPKRTYTAKRMWILSSMQENEVFSVKYPVSVLITALLYKGV